jgi:Cu(I)/Ag(I) efflux system membrane fusion protein
MATESKSAELFNSRAPRPHRAWFALLIWIVAGTGVYWLTSSGCARREDEKPAAPTAPAQSAAKPEQMSVAQPVAAAVKYTCPMHPEVMADKPGKCPICGMNLVPAAKEPNAPASTPMPMATHEG